MAERLADIETIVEFVRKYTPCINGETTMECVERSIRNAPTIEAKPVVHAHWISEDEAEELGHLEWSYSCSNCKEIFWDYTESFAFSYCPHCGAQMDGKVGGRR